MSSEKLGRNVILSLDELEDNLENQAPQTTPTQAIFKKKGLKGKKLNQRKVSLDFDVSDEEIEQKSFPVVKRTKFKSPHSFVTKSQPFRGGAGHTSIEETRNEDIKYTQEHIRELRGEQMERNEDLMDVDEPVVVETTPAEILQEFHKNAHIDNNDEDENITPINEYGSDDNDNDNDFAAPIANSFPADDDLMPNNDDAFIDDGPLNLADSKKYPKLDIDEDLYDMELPIGEEESEIELDVLKPNVSRVIEPKGITEHLETLKKSIENLKMERLETESEYANIKTQFDSIGRNKESLLLELIQ